jgi:hypothetical protein
VSAQLASILEERGQRYGAFAGHANITQALKGLMQGTPGQLPPEQAEQLRAKWAVLAPDQRECLEMIQHKVGRILNGDPDWADSWADIAGYATLVADRLA